MNNNFDWRKERTLVTGATGIVGSSLIKSLLKNGCYVVALVRDWDPRSELMRSNAIAQLSVVSGQLEEAGVTERAITEHEISTVFHLGAQTIVGTALRDPLGTFESNIRGTYLLLEACRRHADLVKQVVVASSDKAYGDSDLLPYTEDMPLHGQHPYDVSKSCTDLLSLTYAHTYELPVGVARCGNIYGPGDLNWSRIVPGTIRSVLAGERPVLRSDGKNSRDYIFVEDVTDGYLRLAEHVSTNSLPSRAFNFSPEARLTVLDIVNSILTFMGRRDLSPVILDTAKAEIKHQYLDSSLARNTLSWLPSYSLEAGLRETIPWYEAFLIANER